MNSNCTMTKGNRRDDKVRPEGEDSPTGLGPANQNFRQTEDDRNDPGERRQGPELEFANLVMILALAIQHNIKYPKVHKREKENTCPGQIEVSGQL